MSPRVLKGSEASGRRGAGAEADGRARERVRARWRHLGRSPAPAQWKLPQHRAKHEIIANVDHGGGGELSKSIYSFPGARINLDFAVETPSFRKHSA